jgi:outer membrane protein
MKHLGWVFLCLVVWPFAAGGVASADATATPFPAAAPRPPASPAPLVLSLTDAEKIALAQSPQLALARATVEQNRAGIGIARSGELPNLEVDATYGRSKSAARFGIPNGHGGFTTTTTALLATQNSAALTLKQLILDGGRVTAEVQAARYSTDAARLTLLRDVQTVLLTVAQQYYAALQARHQLQAAQQSLAVAQVQERLVEAQYKAGIASHADVLTAQLPVAQAQVNVASAQNGEAENVAALLTTMGLPATTPVTLQDDTSISEKPVDLDAAIAEALQQRTDLAAARASLSSAQASVRAAALARFPQIGATASTGTTSTDLSGGNFASDWSLGASLIIPLYSGGLIRSQTDQAKAVESQAQANLKTAELNVYLSVRQAYLGLATADASLKAAQVALNQARVVLDVTNAQYKAGVTTLPLLLNAQSQLTTAQSNYVQALYAYKVAQQNLLYAEGLLLPG